jgi:hypothetical protein
MKEFKKSRKESRKRNRKKLKESSKDFLKSNSNGIRSCKKNWSEKSKKQN